MAKTKVERERVRIPWSKKEVTKSLDEILTKFLTKRKELL